MSALVGIAIGRRALCCAIIDSTGIPRALVVGEGSDAFNRHLLQLDLPGKRVVGSAALFTLLKQPGLRLEQITDLGAAGATAVPLLSECLAQVYSQARIALGVVAAAVVIVCAADCAFTPDEVREAAAQAGLPGCALIEHRTALSNYLHWWLPASVRRCHLLDVAIDGLLTPALVQRSSDGDCTWQVQPATDLPALQHALAQLRGALAQALGVAAYPVSAVLQRLAEQLLLECLSSDSAAQRKTECVHPVRGKELSFTVSDATLASLVQELAECLRPDVGLEATVDASVLCCALLGEDLRAHLLDAGGAMPLLLPRQAQAILAFGAVLAGTTQARGDGAAPQLPGTLGVHAGDRRDDARQRFVALIDAGTVLPAQAQRSFYARSGSGARVLFDFVLQENSGELGLGQVLVGLPQPMSDPQEIQLRVQVSATGECRYAISMDNALTLREGFVARLPVHAVPKEA